MLQTVPMSTHAASLPDRMAPGNYIERVSLLTGEVVKEEIRPDQLLVHSHRDYHVVDVKLVPPSDVSVMDQTPDETLTLITCGGTFDRIRSWGRSRCVPWSLS